MLNSIKNKILIPVAIILLVLAAVLVVYSVISAANLAGELGEQRLETAARTTRSYLELQHERNRVVAQALAQNQVVLELLREWNASGAEESRVELVSYLNSLKPDLDFDAAVVIGADRNVMLRTHEPRYGDSVAGVPIFEGGFAGQGSLNFSSTPALAMGMSALSPIFDDGAVIGTMSVNIFMSVNEFVDQFSESVNAEITIFAGNERVATTLLDEHGQRAVGIYAPEDISEIVLEQNQSFMGEANLQGIDYSTYYFPLLGWDGNPVGMFFAGFNEEASVAAVNSMTLFLIIFGVAGLIAAIFIVLMISGRISKPLKVLSEYMRISAREGDIVVTAEEERIISEHKARKDEIGDLFSSFNDFMVSLNMVNDDLKEVASGNLARDIKVRGDNDILFITLDEMVGNLNRMFEEIQVSTAQVATGSKQIADGSQTLAQGSTEQAASVQQLSSSISEIALKTKDNAKMAEKAAMLANDIRNSAEKGSGQMNDMMTAVKGINESSKNISKVIKSIDDIAFQTNILALNAAVEAARAGQHGKGFAVVAEEVRNLAAKSAEAAKDTESLIADSIIKAELGSKIADETSASLNEIVAGIGESSRLVGDIAKSSEEQTAGITQINTGIDQVANVVQQNSATAEQSAAASEEMSSQSTMLEQLISQFKLKNAISNSIESLPPATRKQKY
ncbi:MAG: methyl-accepting chemotaxis protein [Oscillospiraceae bacterium]|nr:methyl-accepting chemotaxis protein [Oscillospiraceae bacterium]